MISSYYFILGDPNPSLSGGTSESRGFMNVFASSIGDALNIIFRYFSESLGRIYHSQFVTNTATWTESTKRLNSTGAYALMGSDTFYVLVLGGTGVKKGIYRGTAGSSNYMTLNESISEDGVDLTAGDIVSLVLYRYQVGDSHYFVSPRHSLSYDESGVSLGEGVEIDPSNVGVSFYAVLENVS